MFWVPDPREHTELQHRCRSWSWKYEKSGCCGGAVASPQQLVIQRRLLRQIIPGKIFGTVTNITVLLSTGESSLLLLLVQRWAKYLDSKLYASFSVNIFPVSGGPENNKKLAIMAEKNRLNWPKDCQNLQKKTGQNIGIWHGRWLLQHINHYYAGQTMNFFSAKVTNFSRG